jgi:hypothetical protein
MPEPKTTLGENTMTLKSTKLFVGLFMIVAMVGSQFSQLSFAAQKARNYTLSMKDGSVVTINNGKVKQEAAREGTRFIVRIENISSKDFQTASNGEKWPFALSPGMWVIHKNEVRLYNEGRPAILGLEAQAEDGNPSGIIDYLMGHHNQMQHGIFNTPVGAGGPAPIGPGGIYEFSFTAAHGMRLSMITMFGQSNDWFYAPDNDGIDLFENGKPISGDITARFTLYDAGTEADQEPGIGADQAPRQKAPNTGAAENGKVHKAKKSAFYNRTKELFRVTITPEMLP